MNIQKRHSTEFRERDVRLVAERQNEGSIQRAAVQSIAKEFGCTPETLRRWARQWERDQGKRAGLTKSAAEELKHLRRENREPIAMGSSRFARSCRLPRPPITPTRPARRM